MSAHLCYRDCTKNALNGYDSRDWRRPHTHRVSSTGLATKKSRVVPQGSRRASIAHRFPAACGGAARVAVACPESPSPAPFLEANPRVGSGHPRPKFCISRPTLASFAACLTRFCDAPVIISCNIIVCCIISISVRYFVQNNCPKILQLQHGDATAKSGAYRV